MLLTKYFWKDDYASITCIKTKNRHKKIQQLGKKWPHSSKDLGPHSPIMASSYISSSRHGAWWLPITLKI